MATRKAAASKATGKSVKTTKKSTKKSTKKKTAKKSTKKTTRKTTKKAGTKKKAKAAGKRRPAAATASSPAVGLWPTHPEIATRAFQVWERTGKPEGNDYYNWKQAEAELLAERGLA